MRKSVVVLAGIALLGASAALAGENERLRAIGEGRAIYLANCASCHGVRALGTPELNAEVKDVPDLTLIEHRDGQFRAVHVATHVENRDRTAPMPRWPRVFAHEYTVPSQLQIYKLVKYLDTIQRVNESSDLMDSPVPY